MVKGGPAYLLGGVEVVLGGFGRNDNFLESQGVFGDLDHKVLDVPGHVYLPGVGYVSQAGDLQGVSSLLDTFQLKLSVFVRYGPKVVFVQAHYGSRHGLSAGGIHHLAGNLQPAGGKCRSRRRQE